MIAVKTSDVTQDFYNVAERVIQGERVLISFAKNENIIMITESEYNELDKLRENARAELKKSLEALREEAAANGVSDMSIEEIDAEIAAYRREKKAARVV